MEQWATIYLLVVKVEPQTCRSHAKNERDEQHTSGVQVKVPVDSSYFPIYPLL